MASMMASFNLPRPAKAIGNRRFSSHELTMGRGNDSTVAAYGMLITKLFGQLQTVDKRIELDARTMPRSANAELQRDLSMRLRNNQKQALKIRSKIDEYFGFLRKKLPPAAFERFCASYRVRPTVFNYPGGTPGGTVIRNSPGIGRGPLGRGQPVNRQSRPKPQTSSRTSVGRTKPPTSRPAPTTSNPLEDLFFDQKLASVLQNLEQYTKSNEPLTLTSERRPNPAVEASSPGTTDWSDIDQKLASVMQNLEKCSQPDKPLKYRSGHLDDNLAISTPEGDAVSSAEWANIDNKLATVLQNLKKCSQPDESTTSKRRRHVDKPAVKASPRSTDWSDIDQKLKSLLQNLEKCSQSDKPLQCKSGHRPDKTAIVAPLRSGDWKEIDRNLAGGPSKQALGLSPQPYKPSDCKSETLEIDLATEAPLGTEETSLDWPEIDRKLVTVLQNLDKCAKDEHVDENQDYKTPSKIKHRTPDGYSAPRDYKETRTVRINKSPSPERRSSGVGARSRERFDDSKTVRIVTSQRDHFLGSEQNLWSRRIVDQLPSKPSHSANRSTRDIRVSPQRSRSSVCITSVYSRAAPLVAKSDSRSERFGHVRSDATMPSSSVQSHGRRRRLSNPQSKSALFERRSSVERLPPRSAQRPTRRIEASAHIQQSSEQRVGDRIARSKLPSRQEFRGRDGRSNASRRYGAVEPKWSRPGTTPSLQPIPSLAEILKSW